LPEVQANKVNWLRRVFSGHDQEVGEHWEIFSRGTPEQIQSLCSRLSQKGFGELQGQCDPNDPRSYVSRIIAGRSHPKFPKVRTDAQILFLARFTAVGKYMSARTWKRSTSRPDDFLSSPELKIQPEIGWTKEND
jgi:hypothetical protein